MTSKEKYRAAMYLRLSKEDGNSTESMSISNQKELIGRFIETKEDILLCSQRVDDGYSGANFNRPSFQLMMEDVKSGVINCIIVKDLSRFARNFVESERYLQQIFPFLGVRFISINDHLDSLDESTTNQKLIKPVKNLINDAYLADLSLKIRSQLEIKRKKGEYISPHCPYGYLKDSNSPQGLRIDQQVVEVVREIFSRKLEGMSALSMANLLNERGVPSPMEHKNALGLKHSSNFQKYARATWSATAVLRILKNPIYEGTLIQGEYTTFNCKTKKKLKNSRDNMVVFPNHHPAIVDHFTFAMAQEVCSQGGRSFTSDFAQFPLSSLVFCGDCGKTMVKRNNNSAKKPKFIYECTKFKHEMCCSRHAISVEVLEKIVLASINQQIMLVDDWEGLVKIVEEKYSFASILSENRVLLQKKQEEYANIQEKLRLTLEKYQNGELSQEDFFNYTSHFQKKMEKVSRVMEQIELELGKLAQGTSEKQVFMEYFYQNKCFMSLSRKILLVLVEKIRVYEENKLEIDFRFSREFSTFLQSNRKLEVQENKECEKVG